MILKSEYRLNAMAIFSLRSLLQANTRVYGKWEDGLRHRSIGTLVTSAEPRAERIVSLLAFIRYCSERRKHECEKDTEKMKRKRMVRVTFRGTFFSCFYHDKVRK